MPLFSQTVAAYLERRAVACALLVFMDFRLAPRRWWQGFGTLHAGGFDWQGTGTLIAIDGLHAGVGTAAMQTTFTLSGVDPEIVELAREGSDRVAHRMVQVFIQFFEGEPRDAGTPVGALLDQPVALWTGRMDRPKFQAESTSLRNIIIPAENRWVNRNRPPFGLYTDRDQQARYPGDKGLQQVESLASKTVRWV